jgi:hypothetical protein
MPLRLLGSLRAVLALALISACAMLQAQQPDETKLASGIGRIAGTEPTLNIQYARLILKGSLRAAKAGAADPPAPTPPPMLIGQCTLRPNGKYMFEMFTNFGGATDLAFYPPWAPTPQHPSHPPILKVKITMEFLGYTHMKPFRRQWEVPVWMPGQYYFIPPGFGSDNMDEASDELRYMLALPTLRLTFDNRTAEFLTAPLLAEIRKEPLCRAARL